MTDGFTPSPSMRPARQACGTGCHPAISLCSSVALALEASFSRKPAVAEQFSNFREDFQMFLRGGFRHQQEYKQTYRLLIGCIKTNRLGQLKNGGHGCLQPLDAAMRNRHTMPQPGGTQAAHGKTGCR
jgi:hypothetical protein